MNFEDSGKHLIFRLNENGEGPELVRSVFLERGWHEFDEDEHDEYEWNMWWKTSRFRTSDHEYLMPWQRINHYPKSTAITKKDCLARNMKRMAAVYGKSVFNFSPCSYILPNDYTRFVADFTSWQNKNPDKQQYWICKPADMSRGRGIFLFKDLSDLMYDFNAVIQKYCCNPLLISGYKLDLRIYVCVTSFYPLNIYICQEGLARFGTEKFDLGCINNIFSHLTNTSINKFSPTYTSDKERVGSGCKWTLTQLRHYMHQVHLDDTELWSRVISLIIMTVLLQVPQVPSVTNCFELYGFDILIDEKLKPWLLEVNFSPSFSYDCKADADVKKGLIHDILDLMNFQESDCERGGEDYRQLHSNSVRGRTPFSGISHRSSLRSSSHGKSFRHSVSNSKLPRISLSESMSSSRSTLSLMEEEDRENAHPPASLTPGCGLPSVQHASSQSISTSASSGSRSCLGLYGGHADHSHVHTNIKSSIREQKGYERTGDAEVLKSGSEVSSSKSLSKRRVVAKKDSNFKSVTTSAKSRSFMELAPHSSVILPSKRQGLKKTYSSKKSNARSRPWRQVPKKSAASVKTPQENAGPVKRAGNFFLVFPFNDTTQHLTRLATFDMRSAIKETQKQLKQRIALVKVNQNNPTTLSEMLWPPLIIGGSR